MGFHLFVFVWFFEHFLSGTIVLTPQPISLRCLNSFSSKDSARNHSLGTRMLAAAERYFSWALLLTEQENICLCTNLCILTYQ